MPISIAPARAAAFEILLKVATTDAHSDELLRGREVDALSAQDRALATTLVMGTLRWQLVLDERIRALLVRPGVKLAAAVETALRMGAYQLLYLDRIPAHAAIGESVELAKQAGESYAAGMVNAVLRKLARTPGEKSKHEKTAAEAAHPEWMVKRWSRDYGRETARAICTFDQEPAGICVRLAHPEAEQALSDEGVVLAQGEFLTAARRVVSGDVLRSEALRRGWVRIQDEGSQLMAELAGRGSRILDTCAAPGGKTAILAERNPEAEITAMDASRRRLDAMRRNFAGSRVEFVVQDAAEMIAPARGQDQRGQDQLGQDQRGQDQRRQDQCGYDQREQDQRGYDLILCDVPCTGTGTMGRNPEIRFRVTEKEMARQHRRQAAILTRALEALATGGRLVYSTCSMEPEENEDVVAECLRLNEKAEVVRIDQEIARLEREGVVHAEGAARLRRTAVRGGFLRTVPGIHACDGFFAAVLVKH